MFERFTKSARAVVVGAQGHARALHSHRIEPVHLFLGALDHADEPLKKALGAAGFTVDGVLADAQSQDARALKSLGIDLDAIVSTIDSTLGPGALEGAQTSVPHHLPFAASAKEVLKLSLKEAVERRDREIGVEHILLGLVRGADPSFTELVQQQCSLEQLRSVVSLVRTA
ncbi:MULTISPECIES: Clp protease N-terminal domain-containing protein [unclassified Rhodococcus (in: high G+C Gram-positive bacteria)]|uniref:Clp protease N-terminal domain-containing protein n=1 Tax=unclassified Rhodococcus (in: high G+C Gram-positive bacteria) TaxID=192944 RepID=UPI0011F04873|nr:MULTISPECIES: Clp protease N-terminal domain-containing protein [unclassified Rhodococcus (in: high G+C Gram-positive bacteria)]KAA0925313.1 Clp protease [Rhodococcus sp. ANT_H53B]MDI9928520.1 Clp protease N-terminal domain-containing protein [Rhodococcus sp. IEGM 1341]